MQADNLCRWARKFLAVKRTHTEGVQGDRKNRSAWMKRRDGALGGKHHLRLWIVKKQYDWLVWRFCLLECGIVWFLNPNSNLRSSLNSKIISCYFKLLFMSECHTRKLDDILQMLGPPVSMNEEVLSFFCFCLQYKITDTPTPSQSHLWFLRILHDLKQFQAFAF